jgi:hypothetical protein
MDEIKKKFTLHLKLNKLTNSGILPPILLYEVLVHKGFKKCELKQGFMSAGSDHCWHIWIVNQNEVIDINHDLVFEKHENFKHISFDLTTEIPEKFEKNDEFVHMWELYNEDKKKFWKEQPMNVKNFRAKMFNKIFKN